MKSELVSFDQNYCSQLAGESNLRTFVKMPSPEKDYMRQEAKHAILKA